MQDGVSANDEYLLLHYGRNIKQTLTEKQSKFKKIKQDEVEITSESDCESAGTSSVAGYVHFFVVEPLESVSLSKYSPGGGKQNEVSQKSDV
jgi:hypothetical protein